MSRSVLGPTGRHQPGGGNQAGRPAGGGRGAAAAPIFPVPCSFSPPGRQKSATIGQTSEL